MAGYLETVNSRTWPDELNEVMLSFFRSLTGEQRLNLSNGITVHAREAMRVSLRVDHSDWAEWQVTRALAYWCYGTEEMDKVPADVWHGSGRASNR